MTLPPIAFGAIIASVIAGIISIVGLIISKEFKTSEFRQQWIDALRDDISQLIATSTTILTLLRVQVEKCKYMDSSDTADESLTEIAEQFLANLKLEMIQGELVYHRILLRINPEEHVSFVGALEEIRRVWESDKLPSVETTSSIEQSLVRESQLLLKKEWNRVKRGEAVFVFTEWLLGILILVGVLFYALAKSSP